MKTKLDEKLAYFLGYIAWGNHLTANQQYYQISVKPQNKPALVYFNNLFKLNRNIREHEQNGFLRNTLQIPVKNIQHLLDSYYYGARTLLRFDFPPSIPSHLFGAYLRGYFEKHGHIYFYKNGSKSVNIALSMPSEEFTVKLATRLQLEGIFCTPKACRWKGHKTTWRITFSVKSTKALYQLMYKKNFGPKLPIREKLRIIKPAIVDKRVRLIESNQIFSSITQASEKTGIPYTAIKYRLKIGHSVKNQTWEYV